MKSNFYILCLFKSFLKIKGNNFLGGGVTPKPDRRFSPMLPCNELSVYFIFPYFSFMRGTFIHMSRKGDHLLDIISKNGHIPSTNSDVNSNVVNFCSLSLALTHTHTYTQFFKICFYPRHGNRNLPPAIILALIKRKQIPFLLHCCYFVKKIWT